MEEFANFTYLGSVVSSNGDADRNVDCCIGKASAMFQRLCPIWNSPSLSLQIKLQFLATIVVPMATYAYETWKMTETFLDVFHLRCLQHIFNITYRDHITNMEVYGIIYTQPLSTILTKRHIRFSRHILRLPYYQILKMAISWRLAQGKRNKDTQKSPGEYVLWNICEQLTFHGTRLTSQPRIKAVGERLFPYVPNGTGGLKVKVRNHFIQCLDTQNTSKLKTHFCTICVCVVFLGY